MDKENRLKKANLNEAVLVLVIGVIVATLNILHVILEAVKTPTGYIYLAIGHYYLDYLEYVKEIAFGKWGRWSGSNFHLWPFILLGKIAAIFNFSPVFIYWLAVFLLTFALVILMFVAIKRLLPQESFFIQFWALLIAVFASPWIKLSRMAGRFKIDLYEFWYGPSNFFRRFGSVPYHILSTVLILLAILMIASILENAEKPILKKNLGKILTVAAIMVLVVTFSPFSLLTLLVTFCLTTGFYLIRACLKKRKTSFLFILMFMSIVLILVLPTCLIIKLKYNYKGISLLETRWIEHVSVWFVFANIGPIVVFFPLALMALFKKISPIKLSIFIYVTLSYVFFFSNLAYFLGTHNLRFLTTINYILFGVLGALGIKRLSQIVFGKKLFVGLMVILMIFYFFIDRRFFKDKVSETETFFSYNYLPQDLITGLSKISSGSDKEIVLTPFNQFLGLLVPIFSNKEVYLGRYSEGIGFESKAFQAERFYKGVMSEQEAVNFISKEKISFVVLTSFDSYSAQNIDSYRFLKPIFSNNSIMIWEYDANAPL